MCLSGRLLLSHSCFTHHAYLGLLWLHVSLGPGTGPYREESRLVCYVTVNMLIFTGLL